MWRFGGDWFLSRAQWRLTWHLAPDGLRDKACCQREQAHGAGHPYDSTSSAGWCVRCRVGDLGGRIGHDRRCLPVVIRSITKLSRAARRRVRWRSHQVRPWRIRTDSSRVVPAHRRSKRTPQFCPLRVGSTSDDFRANRPRVRTRLAHSWHNGGSAVKPNWIAVWR